ncbi:MAG: YlbF family regulator [Ruminococcaceae bacterium]|jgi:cell fate (sporulation/competence/biofilm development) regulator YlbF (YheA/YmcA/DUF963 family)|nr:YlbF family regulator [Oscillospiraceae bacterium]
MDVIAIARQLGAAIQEDEKYKKLHEAKVAIDNDAEIQDMMAKIEELRVQYQAAATSETPDEKLMDKLDKDFQNVYTALMVTEGMSVYEGARKELDDMMNFIMQILYLSVNGEDPATCDPAAHNCGPDCSSCAGC